MDENKWLRRKPQSNLDYLGITLIAVAFYMALLNAQSFLNGVNAFWASLRRSRAVW